ncbi:hypothetical protein [Bradyrhizobium sp. Mp27]|uniref:hypothetical protein n=1 Tax=Bradyrhizobium sp. Mp27 TaxID=3042157 RepID=UPI00248BE26F|nr:hypothetical protein [Bradyrhizobium sp. Mp27]MDI2073057.1 hypothetical protein [Bradyrhizobium sp. Mp27]
MVGLIPMSMDGLSPVLLMLISNRFKYLAMSGTEMYRRNTRLGGFSLEMTADEEEATDLANAR